MRILTIYTYKEKVPLFRLHPLKDELARPERGLESIKYQTENSGGDFFEHINPDSDHMASEQRRELAEISAGCVEKSEEKDQ